MTASGTDSYTTAYTYDANNRLTTEAKTQSGTTTTSVFTYDDNGNLLTELDATNTAVVTHSYDGFNRLISSVVGTTTITYTYNAQGIRTSRQVGNTYTQYLLDGGNVVGEVTDGTVTAYLRGANLISDGTNYYLYNAHGDVVQLTDSTGAVVKTYEYDAFGNEKAPVDGDINPFRYCGEYYDTETGLYYLRARYYDPAVGRFTQEDTHWNTANMIYGDNPQKINEREDALGLKTYSYAPQILSIIQAGNLYAYTTNNPLKYHDESGEMVEEDCIQEDPEEMLIPDKDAIGAPSAGGYGPAFGGYVVGGKGHLSSAEILDSWASGTFNSSGPSILYHYYKHVVIAGLSGKISIAQYTQDALNFAKNNSNMLRFTYNYRYGNTSWHYRYSPGRGGHFTSSGKIITFWYGDEEE